MSDRSPFGDEVAPAARRPHPFGEGPPTEAPGDAAGKIEQAARKIRGLRSQLGSEGLTLAGTRELIDEIATALDAAARALRSLEEA